VSERPKNYGDLLIRKLRKLQLKLIEKQYGSLAAFYMQTIFKGEITGKDLRRSEAMLEILARYHRTNLQLSRKVKIYRKWFLNKGDGIVLLIAALVLQLIVSVYLLTTL
jgi:hypothetical protein